MLPLWRKIQRNNFTNVSDLLQFLELEADVQLRPRFPLNLPRRLAEKIAKGNVNDPILRQFLPLAEELNKAQGFSLEPVKDTSFQKTKKTLHKYKGRVLLVTTSACAMNCRFCFRQNFPYEVEEKGFDEELEYIKANTDVEEVILSGGDPLSLSDRTLKALLQALDAIPHVKRIRFHSRFPVGIPERITDEFVAALPKQTIFIVHINHPSELDDDVAAALKKMKVPVLNQAVLLKGVNDDEKTQHALCSKLVNHGIIPYYLHMLDPVQGAHHFNVSEERGKEIIQYLQHNLSGYAVPRLVREIPGEMSKTLI